MAKHGYESILSWQVVPAPDGHLRVMDVHGVWHDDCDVVVFQRWMHRDGETMARRAQEMGAQIRLGCPVVALEHALCYGKPETGAIVAACLCGDWRKTRE